MKIKTVCFNAIQLTISSNFWLTLVKIALGTSFAIKLFDLVTACIKQVTVISFLVTCREASKDQNVL